MSKKKDFKVQLNDEEYAEYLTRTEKPTTPSTEPVVVEPTNPANPVTGTGNNETAAGGEAPTVTPTPTPTTAPVMTYQEWYDNNINRVTEKANEVYDASVSNAQLTYEQALGAYGTNAERLASMGLSNSGYSDYLKTRAYDTYRSEVSAAEKLRSDTIADAELTYGELLLGKQETERANNLSSYVTNAENGLYTSEQIEDIIKNNRYTEVEADALRGALKSYNNQRNLVSADVSNKIAGGEFANWNALSSYATAAGLDPESFRGEYTNQLYNDISTALTEGVALNDAMMTELQSLDGAKYNEIKQKYNEAHDTSEEGFKKDGVLVSKAEAQALMKSIKADKYLSPSKKALYESTYNTLYCAEVIQGAEIRGTASGHELIGSKGQIIADHITLGAKENDETIEKAAQKIQGPAVFRLNGEIYYKSAGGQIYRNVKNIPPEVFDNNNTEFIE